MYSSIGKKVGLTKQRHFKSSRVREHTTSRAALMEELTQVFSQVEIFRTSRIWHQNILRAWTTLEREKKDDCIIQDKSTAHSECKKLGSKITKA